MTRRLIISIGSAALITFAFTGLDWLTGFTGGDWMRDFAVAIATAVTIFLWSEP